MGRVILYTELKFKLKLVCLFGTVPTKNYKIKDDFAIPVSANSARQPQLPQPNQTAQYLPELA